MASIIKQDNGRRILKFRGVDCKPYWVRLGFISENDARAMKAHIEALYLRAKDPEQYPLERSTRKWLKNVSDKIRSKLIEAGLCGTPAARALGNFLAGHIAEQKQVKPGTLKFYHHTERNLVEFFGPDKPIEEITPGDADRFVVYLKTTRSLQGRLRKGRSVSMPIDPATLKPLSLNTIRRRCDLARQFFRAAVRKKLISENPFTELKGLAPPGRNVKRDRFIGREVAQKVLDACPNAQLRLIFALSRFGGLRCPSEILGLRWEDVDWANGRMTVHSPKTEHHPGRESRVIPIFPELHICLTEVWELAEPGVNWVVTYRPRNADQIYRKELLKILKRAEIPVWPKLFQNLRASRATELVEKFPSHVAAAWLGHTEAIAEKHYRQVTEEHFARATAFPESKAHPKAHLHSVAPGHIGSGRGRNGPVCGTMQPHSDSFLAPMGDDGFEPPTSTL
jgi:integrase